MITIDNIIIMMSISNILTNEGSRVSLHGISNGDPNIYKELLSLIDSVLKNFGCYLYNHCIERYVDFEVSIPKEKLSQIDEIKTSLEKSISDWYTTKQELNKNPVYEYYYKVNGCTAKNSNDPDCKCWHLEGTGIFRHARHTEKAIKDTHLGVPVKLTWRETKKMVIDVAIKK